MIPGTLIQHPSDGVHLLFKVPPGVTIKNDQKKTGAGIDIRGDNGPTFAKRMKLQRLSPS